MGYRKKVQKGEVTLVGFYPNKFFEAFLRIKADAEGKKERYKVRERKESA